MARGLRVAIRADASEAIGSGHVMRCMALADALADAGANVTFFTRGIRGPARDRLKDAQSLSATVYLDDREAAEADDALELVVGLHDASENGARWDWVVVDSYQLGSAWEREVASRTSAQILAIDDLATRPHHCNVLLDQNAKSNSVERYRLLTPPRSTLLTGPKFALLRPEYREVRLRARRRRDAMRRVLVTFGGGDPTGETRKVLSAYSMLSDPLMELDVVVSAANESVEYVPPIGNYKVRFHRNLTDLSRLMADADIAICAGGSTTWERMCVGVPAIVIATASNQCETSEYLGGRGYQLFLGESSNVAPVHIADALRRLGSDPGSRTIMMTAGRRLVDGLGARRVAATMQRLTRTD